MFKYDKKKIPEFDKEAYLIYLIEYFKALGFSNKRARQKAKIYLAELEKFDAHVRYVLRKERFQKLPETF